MTYRIDFYLDEPLNSQKALADLRAFTETSKHYLGLPAATNVLWIKSPSHNLLLENLPDTFAKVQIAIENPTQIVIFWAAEYNITLDSALVKEFNQFADSLPNPVMLVTGLLGNWTQQWNSQTSFTISPLLYFDYEATTAWDNNIDLPVTRNKKFLSMGTKDYPNRKFILSNILTHNLKDSGYVSYAQLGNGTLSTGLYTPEQIAHITCVADQANSYLPLELLDANPDAWVKMPRQFLTDSYLNMVTDTFYEVHDLGATFLSEKVFNAMIHKQLFIMLSPPGTLAYLREQGYQTFHDVIDESYDSIENNYDRLIAVNKSFIEFVSKPIEEIQDIYKACAQILEHNRSRAYAKPLPDIILKELSRAQYEKAQAK